MDKPWKVRLLAWKVHLKAWKVRLKAWTTIPPGAHNACLIGSDALKPLSLQHFSKSRASVPTCEESLHASTVGGTPGDIEK